MMTLKDFDDAIECIEKPSGDKHVDDLMHAITPILRNFKRGYLDLINELLVAYDLASEHNVDISRDYIFRLTQRLAGVSTDTSQSISE